jgi:zinc/manganese transport system permease protein
MARRSPSPGSPGSRILRHLRWGTAAILAASALWIAAFPRADHPLLDGIEHVVPQVRAAYMDEKSRRIAAEAQTYAERYRGEAAKLREKEAERRWKGEAMEEIEIRRVASFLKSYNEMIKGETFVAREVRSRARAAQRWPIAGAFLLMAALVFIVPFGRRTPLKASAEARLPDR